MRLTRRSNDEGIGVAAARGVLMRGGDVVLVSRDASHLAATHNKLAQQLGLRVLDEKHKRIETAVCDSTEVRMLLRMLEHCK